MIRFDQGHLRSSRPRDFRLLFELQWYKPLPVNFQLLAHQIGRRPAAVDWSMAPGPRKADVMIAVEVTEEIRVAPLDGSVSKRIHAEGEARDDLVERTRPLISLFATGRNLVGRRCIPCCIFRVAGHELRKGRPRSCDARGIWVTLRWSRDSSPVGKTHSFRRLQLRSRLRVRVWLRLWLMFQRLRRLPIKTIVDMYRDILEQPLPPAPETQSAQLTVSDKPVKTA